MVINNSISNSTQSAYTVASLPNTAGSVPVFGQSNYGAGSGAVTNHTVAVPEGGSTLLFVLAALTAIGFAATKRYWSRIEGRTTAARITG
jgi:hypothetical protein